jgi:hypothetical protein
MLKGLGQEIELMYFKQKLIVCVVDPDPHGSALILVGWIWIRTGNPDTNSGEKKIIHKNRKSEEISCFEVLDVLF